MKILLALPYSPCPVRRGTDRLTVNLIEGLSIRHEVVLATMTIEELEERALAGLAREGVEVRSIRAPNRRGIRSRIICKARNAFLAATTWIPMQVLYAAPPQFIDLVADLSAGVDLVLASYWHLYRLPGRLAGVPHALVTHDIDFSVNRMRLHLVEAGPRRLLARIGAAAKERVERLAYERYGTILALTGSDASILQELFAGTGKVIATLPLALSLDHFNPAGHVRAENRILLMGHFGADFNRDALRFFTSEVFPLVRAKRPDTVLDVVGPGGNEVYARGPRDGVRFAGYAEDIRIHLGECTVMVLPLRFGGGVRIRMMEAAAMGAPVVSTPVGVGGMGLRDGVDYLEAETAEDLAAAVLRMLGDGNLRERISREVRRWAERTISMETYPDRLDELLDFLSSSSRKRRM